MSSGSGSDTDERCDVYKTIDNSTQTIAYSNFGGIPQVFGYNLLFFLVILVLFAICRKIARDYGRIALVHHGEERWTEMFFGNQTSQPESKEQVAKERDGAPSNVQMPHIEEQNLCSWIGALFRIKDEHIRLKNGVDAVQYLSFQRYIIALLATLSVFSLIVILPVNTSGSQEGGKANFGRTTISNLPTNSPLLWVHTVFALVYTVLVLGFMRHFTTHLQFKEQRDKVTRTLFISGIPLERTDPALIKQHFQEAYPDMVVTHVQFAYDIAKLKSLDAKRQAAKTNRLHCLELLQKTGERPQLRVGTCGQISCCDACGGPFVDAIDYYSEREKRLTDECAEERRIAYSSNLGMVFVTSHSENMAAKVVSEYNTLKTGRPTISSVSNQLETAHWDVDYAPYPDNIYWENLAVGHLHWWSKAILVNLLLFLVLFFLTTPSVILTSLNEINYKKAFDQLHSPFVSQFLPTLLLWTFAALLPWIVSYTSYKFESHWTKSTENHVVMRKTFAFLIFMLLILPSLGLSSLQAFFEYTLSANEDVRMRWNCMFLPDNGAFFVNYVITSALIGSALELIRFPELFYYFVTMLWTRSKAEKISKRKELVWDFQYGVQYAWTLCIFCIILTYSLVCPLIVPFGVLYMGFKHLVDRFNMFFAYGPSRINNKIHNSAVNFVVISVILLQSSLLFFSILRLGSVDPRTIVTAVMLVITLGLFIAKLCFNVWMGFTPNSYQEFSNMEEPDEEEQQTDEPTDFVPDVLKVKPEAENGGSSYLGGGGGGGGEEGDPAKYGAPPREAYGATSSFGETLTEEVSSRLRQQQLQQQQHYSTSTEDEGSLLSRDSNY